MNIELTQSQVEVLFDILDKIKELYEFDQGLELYNDVNKEWCLPFNHNEFVDIQKIRNNLI